jgi:hypothetical protein
MYSKYLLLLQKLPINNKKEVEQYLKKYLSQEIQDLRQGTG